MMRIQYSKLPSQFFHSFSEDHFFSRNEPVPLTRLRGARFRALPRLLLPHPHHPAPQGARPLVGPSYHFLQPPLRRKPPHPSPTHCSQVGSIGGNTVYGVKATEMVPIKPAELATGKVPRPSLWYGEGRSCMSRVGGALAVNPATGKVARPSPW